LFSALELDSITGSAGIDIVSAPSEIFAGVSIGIGTSFHHEK
jgi:hypothetical protein